MTENVCPRCGSSMEPGSLAAESYGATTWHLSRTLYETGGEKIGDYQPGGLVWFDGRRCSRCRILVLHY